MARRRMFSLDVVDTDRFLDMPTSAQNLYYSLGMRADDDGFVSNPKRIAASCGSCIDDLRLLILPVIFSGVTKSQKSTQEETTKQALIALGGLRMSKSCILMTFSRAAIEIAMVNCGQIPVR